MSERCERYQDAMTQLDMEALGELRHPDYVCYYPQSGESLVGHEKWVGAHKDYWAKFQPPATTVKGGERKAEVIRTTTPTFSLPTPMVQISDTGDLAIMEGRGTWPDGKVYNWVSIIEYKEGLVWRETQYFAEPFDPPEWRAPFVQLDEEVSA